jgi:hypothetical protein
MRQSFKTFTLNAATEDLNTLRLKFLGDERIDYAAYELEELKNATTFEEFNMCMHLFTKIIRELNRELLITNLK